MSQTINLRVGDFVIPFRRGLSLLVDDILEDKPETTEIEIPFTDITIANYDHFNDIMSNKYFEPRDAQLIISELGMISYIDEAYKSDDYDKINEQYQTFAELVSLSDYMGINTDIVRQIAHDLISGYGFEGIIFLNKYYGGMEWMNEDIFELIRNYVDTNNDKVTELNEYKLGQWNDLIENRSGLYGYLYLKGYIEPGMVSIVNKLIYKSDELNGTVIKIHPNEDRFLIFSTDILIPVLYQWLEHSNVSVPMIDDTDERLLAVYALFSNIIGDRDVKYRNIRDLVHTIKLKNPLKWEFVNDDDYSDDDIILVDYDTYYSLTLESVYPSLSFSQKL